MPASRAARAHLAGSYRSGSKWSRYGWYSSSVSRSRFFTHSCRAGSEYRPQWTNRPNRQSRNFSTECAGGASVIASSPWNEELTAAQSGDEQAADEVFLQQDDEQHGRQHRQHRGRHHQVPLGAGLPAELSQAERNGALGVDAVHYDQRPQEAAPEADEGEDGQYGQRRPGQRQHDPQEGSERSAPVYPRRLLQLCRNGEEELPEQEGAERGEGPREDQGPVAVDPAEGLHQPV